MKIAITIYYNSKSEKFTEMTKRNHINRLKLLYSDFDKYEIQFFDLDNLPEIEKEYCRTCGTEIE